MKVLNSFSLNMLHGFPVHVAVKTITLNEAIVRLREGGIESFVGHLPTAEIFSELTGMDIPMNRGNAQLNGGEVALVGQYVGPRLDEGAKTLPIGAKINFFLVRVAHTKEEIDSAGDKYYADVYNQGGFADDERGSFVASKIDANYDYNF